MDLPESAFPAVAALRRLEVYGADLRRWGRAQNLVSRKDPDFEIRRLIAESVAVARWLRAGVGLVAGPWADVGSGAGFPGVVLGCCFEGQRIDLIERRRGRCDFLRREVASLGLSQARILCADAQQIDVPPGGYALIALKAVAPPAEALALAAPLLGVGGRALLFQRPDWVGAPHWSEVGRWVGAAGVIDLSDRAVFLLAPAG